MQLLLHVIVGNLVIYPFVISVEKSSGDANKNLQKLTKDHITGLSERLGTDWKKLATELGFPEDDIEYFARESDDKKQATKMLTVWLVSFVNVVSSQILLALTTSGKE